MACNDKSLYKESAMWLFLYSIETSAAIALTARLSLESKLFHYTVDEGVLTAFCQVVNHLLETYATNDIIAESNREIARYIKL